MKKNLISILLFVIAMPFMVDAKEYCKVVDGDGKSIGSEIACGTEHFYIVDSNEDEIKMLAKYNLKIGFIIDKIENTGFASDLNNGQNCNVFISTTGGEYTDYNTIYPAEGYCYVKYPITTDKVLQSEDAIGAHWDENGNYAYPQVGDVYIENYRSTYNNGTDDYYDFEVIPESVAKYDNYFYELRLGNHNITRYLQEYNSNIIDMGYTVKNIDLLSFEDIDKIAKKHNSFLPYSEWHNNSISITFPTSEFGSLVDLLSNKEKFIYNTTYWLKNGYDLYTNSHADLFFVNNIVFVDSRGGVCSSPFNNSGSYSGCYPEITGSNEKYLGAGVRPVITIPNELIYQIKSATDGNGTIDVIESSLGGEKIQFNISTKKGYKLESIMIRTDSGKEVEFSEGEITKNDDGTLSIDKNKFTMPFENVTIQAKFIPDGILINPETGDKVLFIILILLSSIGIGTSIYIKKESRYNV